MYRETIVVWRGYDGRFTIPGKVTRMDPCNPSSETAKNFHRFVMNGPGRKSGG